ncbi:MAG TPA: dephospho-CoA kinase [Leucothrix mucor]|nr:dephospho-CoA kinase [Leucothrix mucor]
MLKVGLTGGIGCGKSTAVDAFRVLDVPIIDADKISKDLVKPGQSALTEIIAQFGKKIIKSNGELNRSLLKKIVFSDSSSLKKLENILHPLIKKEIKRQMLLLETQQTSQPRYIIVDVPLLLEKNYEELFDRIIIVDCLPEQQIERVMQRDKLDKKTIKNIIQTQINRKDRLKRATDILDNSKNEHHLIEQINNFHSQYLI